MSSNGKFVSGVEISKQLYVSRNAVWKAINSLRADGFIIDAAQNKGYLLSGGETDDFTRYGILRIRQLLKKSAADADITIKDTVTSTNTLLRISAENGAPSKTVLIANEQTEGRGRHGKSFYSPADTGIYMSVLLRPAARSHRGIVGGPGGRRRSDESHEKGGRCPASGSGPVPGNGGLYPVFQRSGRRDAAPAGLWAGPHAAAPAGAVASLFAA